MNKDVDMLNVDMSKVKRIGFGSLETGFLYKDIAFEGEPEGQRKYDVFIKVNTASELCELLELVSVTLREVSSRWKVKKDNE